MSIADRLLPLFYVSDRQINALIPYDIDPRATRITIHRGKQTATYPISIASSAPGIFLRGGAALALNEDGTLNSPANPARRGSRVTMFATGMGRLTVPLPSDVLTRVASSVVEPFELYIGAPGVTGAAGMRVIHAGAVPDTPPGVIRIDAAIPEIASTGARVPLRMVLTRPNSQLLEVVSVAVAP